MPDLYRHGDWRVTCQRCGRKRYASDTVKEWTGLIVCREHADIRHPQDFVRGRRDQQNVAFARPVPVYEFVDYGTISLAGSTVTEDDVEGTLVGVFSITPASASQDFRLLDDAGGRFKLDPADTSRLLVGSTDLDTSVATTHTITVAALWQSLGTDFTITVTAGLEGWSLNFTLPKNSLYVGQVV